MNARYAVFDGRFCGLGLMAFAPRAMSSSDVSIFRLHGDNSQSRQEIDRPSSVPCAAPSCRSRATTRAVWVLFSGHEPDGQSDSAGHHAHVFLAVDGDGGGDDDGSITRLIVAAPWVVDRRAGRPSGRQRRFFGDVVRRLTELRAGPLGRFDGLVAEFIGEGDSLLGPANLWIGRTPYIATRNLKKRDDPAGFVKTDVLAECRRRGLPSPAEVEVHDVRSGPRGGRPAATLSLRFATAVRGPILLGRDSHLGGGLFRAVSFRE